MDQKAMYWAHSANVNGDWHELRIHLESVAEMSRKYAEHFKAGEWAFITGLWHDLGKFSQAFQEYLQKASSDDAHAAELKGTVDHTSAGAQHAVATIEVLGHILAFVIVGHHAGLLDAISDGACLDRRLHKTIEPWQHGLRLLAQPILPELPFFLRERLAERSDNPKGVSFSLAFFTRLIFSCLVDADFLDTESFLDPVRFSARASWPQDILSRMTEYLDEFAGRLAVDDSPVNRLRREVRQVCQHAARESPGLFSLTVPTGGGKTLSSLSFALEHAVRHGLHRIIYVVPFTTIIEQNADVFRRVFAPLTASGYSDPVVEHHSALDVGEETLASRLAAENWDAPLIVTTSVQFYESLFANRATRCRKLHNLAKSVIILDEVQKLPVEYMTPCLLALRELASGYGATIVLCTATQPAIQRQSDFTIGLEEIREIIPEPRRLYVALKRVEIKDLGEMGDEGLAARLRAEPQVLCIVNTRGHARQLFKQIAEEQGAIHLSAAMCPQHRSEVLQAVRALLAEGKPCHVVSTQLVEAGVDLDFPVVYRSLAGLDSIAQAAGRCNRNGRFERGITYLFRSEHGRSEAFLRDTANATAQLLGDETTKEPLYQDILSLEAVQHYFELYYWSQQQRWDTHGILDHFKMENRRELPFLFGFKSAAESFRLIEDGGRPVIIPWHEEGRQLCERLRGPWLMPRVSLLRALQRYTVQVPSRTWQAEIGRSIQMVHEQFALLISTELNYDERVGLVLDRRELSIETMML